MGLLRLWLATIVLAGHAGVDVGARGGIAVSAFFVISGFLIQLVISERYAAADRGWIPQFYCSRALRIFPLYYLFAVLTVPLALAYNETFAAALRSGNVATQLAMAASNISLFGHDVFRFLRVELPSGDLALRLHAPSGLAGPNLSVLPQAWSLSIELMFYLLAPFILTKSTRVLVAVALVFCMVRLATTAALGPDANENFRWSFFPSEIPTFLIGALAYRLSRTGLPIGRLPAVAALGVIVVYTLAFDHIAGLGEPAAAGAFCVLVAALLPSLERATRGNRLDRFAGELSYPMYIGHITLAQLLAVAGIPVGSVRGLALWLLTVAVSVPLVLLVERPMSGLRRRLWRPAPHSGGATAPAPARA